MTGRRRVLLWMNLVLGPLVLASYWLGASMYDGPTADFWGTVPVAVQPVYVANMICAAAGYLTFTAWWLWGAAVPGRRLLTAYALVLVPSAMWMPLCAFAMNHAWTGAMPLIVGVLGAVALGSLMISHATWRARAGKWPRWGGVSLCLQTLVLDLAIWPWFFDVSP